MNKSLKLKLIVVIISISFCQGLQFAISPVLTQIHEHFQSVSVSLVQMLIAAPSMLAMVIALISGWLSVKISKKKLLVFGSFISGAAGLLPLLSDSFGLLFFSRTFYGVGLGIASCLNTAVVAEFFEGREKDAVMGIQSASIGAGMLLETTLSGILGSYDFRYAYLVHIIGFVAMVLISRLLPESGRTESSKTEKPRLNEEVFRLSFIGLLEFLFLISFSTNIAMHLSGKLAGNASVSGLVTGVFSGSQIVIGLLLGYITKYTGKYSIPTAMLSFTVGAFILVLFPSNLVLILVGAVFCGFSQGMFIPRAMCDVTNAVKPIAAALASACLTCGMCIGQILSPGVLNLMSGAVFGIVTTSHVLIIAAVGMAVAAAFSTMTGKRNHLDCGQGH